jgi:NAD(P)-dependent dehydrogenase (short-subunit alcohol dehydrogenase family)
MATQRTAIVTGGMGGLGESISIKLRMRDTRSS